MRNQKWKKNIINGNEVMELIEDIELPDPPVIKSNEERIIELENKVNKLQSDVQIINTKLGI